MIWHRSSMSSIKCLNRKTMMFLLGTFSDSRIWRCINLARIPTYHTFKTRNRDGLSCNQIRPNYRFPTILPYPRKLEIYSLSDTRLISQGFICNWKNVISFCKKTYWFSSRNCAPYTIYKARRIIVTDDVFISRDQRRLLDKGDQKDGRFRLTPYRKTTKPCKQCVLRSRFSR